MAPISVKLIQHALLRNYVGMDEKGEEGKRGRPWKIQTRSMLFLPALVSRANFPQKGEETKFHFLFLGNFFLTRVWFLFPRFCAKFPPTCVCFPGIPISKRKKKRKTNPSSVMQQREFKENGDAFFTNSIWLIFLFRFVPARFFFARAKNFWRPTFPSLVRNFWPWKE